MAKLFSHHDRLHVHGILGFAVLAHFIFRFSCFFSGFGDTFAASASSAATLGIHSFLHVTSFQFDLPRNRMFSKPMIWKEFRLHNLIFAHRHIVATALGVWAPNFWWRELSPLSVAVKVALVLVTSKVADVVTQKLGSEEKRTTNAMPYPEQTAQSVEDSAKWFYAKSQFAATALAVFAPPFLAFAPILAIEIASFLMTLVRKGIIEGNVLHIVYVLSLLIVGPAMILALHLYDEAGQVATFRAFVATAMSTRLRMKLGANKYVTWLVAIVGTVWLVPLILESFPLRPLAYAGTAWSVLDSLATFRTPRRNSRLYGLVLEKASAATRAVPAALKGN